MIQTNLDQARFNMVEQQIRTWEVLDMEVLDLIMTFPREDFVPEKYRNLAYMDIAIPIAEGQMTLHPKIEAHIMQALKIQPTDTVLEVGTGCGYLTALMAQKASQVFSVDIYPSILKSAGERIRAHNITNVTLEEGDASKGWDDHAPYDAIAITGSLPELPESFKTSLKVGGRLFAVVGDEPAMEALIVTRTGENQWTSKALFETDLPRLVNSEKPPQFEF
jgi:protein-L-isoaspartate(D-aspartate) O-methyltransferase